MCVLQAVPAVSVNASGNGKAAGEPAAPAAGKPNGQIPADEMTSKDYYFDSYAHFGIHEVCIDLYVFAVDLWESLFMMVTLSHYLFAKTVKELNFFKSIIQGNGMRHSFAFPKGKCLSK